MKKRSLSMLLALLMLFSLAGCGGSGESENAPSPEAEQVPAQESPAEEAPAETRTITDMLGRQVELPAVVERIVPLGNTPRMISYLGLQDKVVGYSGTDLSKVTPVCAYAYANRERWADLPLVGTDGGGQSDYHYEDILAVQPDIILCTSPLETAEDIQAKTGIPVVAVDTGNVMKPDYDQCLLILGEACGIPEKAQEVVDYTHALLDDLNARTKDIPDAKKPTALSAAATFKGSHGIEGVRPKDPVMDALNAKNVAAELAEQGRSIVVDLEQILLWNPEYIFLETSGLGHVRQDMKDHPDYYTKLQAFSNDNVYVHPSSTYYFQNLEVPLANAYFVGSILYPEAFADIDVREKANEIFNFYLGVDDYMSELEAVDCGFGKFTPGEGE